MDGCRYHLSDRDPCVCGEINPRQACCESTFYYSWTARKICEGCKLALDNVVFDTRDIRGGKIRLSCNAYGEIRKD